MMFHHMSIYTELLYRGDLYIWLYICIMSWCFITCLLTVNCYIEVTFMLDCIFVLCHAVSIHVYIYWFVIWRWPLCLTVYLFFVMMLHHMSIDSDLLYRGELYVRLYICFVSWCFITCLLIVICYIEETFMFNCIFVLCHDVSSHVYR
jgi:hypothetical protein